MNHLQHSRSPYLRQHANNPVDWYPWGEEALSLARRTGRPVLVSIGYSTCHWCHVMEDESFTDPDVAAYMNAHFVNIKVDREERPDLDQLYMQAVQVLTGQSGWPLHVFLTPDLRPFYGGTYFPPQPDGRRLAWFQALQLAAYNFFEQRAVVEREADRVQHRLEKNLVEPTATTESGTTLPAYRDRLLQQLDRVHGGFGSGRKFPNIPALDFLLRWHYHHGDQEALQAVQFSVERMLWSGTYDLVGGGLMRYSIRPDWSVPHFEKMLYDNALLIRLLADLYRIDQNPEWAWFLRHTIAFLERELALPDGGYAAALDADSDGGEGRYYTWTLTEWQAALPEHWADVGRWFAITETGNWDGTNTLHPDGKRTTEEWEPWQQRLLAHRTQRPAPARDGKVVNSWNSLLLTALVHAWEALGEPSIFRLACRQRDFLQQTFPSPDGHLWRIAWQGDTYQRGFLEDYTFFAEAMIAAYRLEYDPAPWAVAQKVVQRASDLFAMPEHRGGWYSTSREQTHIFLRKQADLDEELPAASAWFGYCRHLLGIGLDQREWRWSAEMSEQAEQQLQRPETTGVSSWGAVALAEAQGIRELAITGRGAREEARRWMAHYHPDLLLMAADQPPEKAYPLLQHRHHEDENLRFYLCRDYACRQPVKNPDALLDIWTDS